jgi:hypothetical protein
VQPLWTAADSLSYSIREHGSERGGGKNQGRDRPILDRETHQRANSAADSERRQRLAQAA